MAGKIKYKFFLESENFGTYCSDYVLDASGYAEVYPQYDDEFGIKWEREQDQIFFRKQIDGELTFVCANGIRDYNCLHYLPIDEEIILRIFNSCDDYLEPIYTGSFTKRNMFWDEDERIATINDLITYGEFPCISRNWETEYNIVDVTDYIVNRTGKPEIFQYCKRIAEVIQYLLDEMGCNFIYQSMFFDNDLTADTDNYVSGTDPNPLNNLMISDKSNILAEADTGGGGGGGGLRFDQATISDLSLRTLLETLKNLYDIRWHIDSDGYFRIEHISFYTNTPGILPLNDLTTLINEYTNKEYAYRMNKYDYLDLPGREEFIYSEKGSNVPLEGSAFFEDWYYDYTYNNRFPDGTKDTKGIINHTISGFTNDLGWMCDFPEKPNKEGFVILAVIPDGGDYQTQSILNLQLHWGYLTSIFFRHYRPFIYAIEGYINGGFPAWVMATFKSKRRSKKQIPIEIHGCCDPFNDDFNIFDLIKTWLGNGEIYNFKYTLSSGAVTVELLHEAEDIEKPVLL